jgi:hypothetical protein
VERGDRYGRLASVMFLIPTVCANISCVCACLAQRAVRMGPENKREKKVQKKQAKREEKKPAARHTDAHIIHANSYLPGYINNLQTRTAARVGASTAMAASKTGPQRDDMCVYVCVCVLGHIQRHLHQLNTPPPAGTGFQAGRASADPVTYWCRAPR